MLQERIWRACRFEDYQYITLSSSFYLRKLTWNSQKCLIYIIIQFKFARFVCLFCAFAASSGWKVVPARPKCSVVWWPSTVLQKDSWGGGCTACYQRPRVYPSLNEAVDLVCHHTCTPVGRSAWKTVAWLCQRESLFATRYAGCKHLYFILHIIHFFEVIFC